jgi:hypothetical protein
MTLGRELGLQPYFPPVRVESIESELSKDGRKDGDQRTESYVLVCSQASFLLFLDTGQRLGDRM